MVKRSFALGTPYPVDLSWRQWKRQISAALLPRVIAVKRFPCISGISWRASRDILRFRVWLRVTMGDSRFARGRSATKKTTLPLNSPSNLRGNNCYEMILFLRLSGANQREEYRRDGRCRLRVMTFPCTFAQFERRNINIVVIYFGGKKAIFRIICLCTNSAGMSQNSSLKRRDSE